ncbi:MAG: hypothetical protein ACRC5M_04960 [Anaeroplasmataceae bacterium]
MDTNNGTTKLTMFNSLSRHQNRIDSILPDIDEREETLSIYEKKVNDFLNTWLTFNCRNRNCCNNKSDEELDLVDSELNVVEYTFYQIFGEDYTKNLFEHMLRRLTRFRHILLAERNTEFEAAYSDYKNKENKVFKKVLSKTDRSSLLSRYKSIFNFYKEIVHLTNEDMIKLFHTIITDLTNSYIENNSEKSKVFPFLESDIFFNNTLYSELREKALVIFYEAVARFYKYINIDPCMNKVPLPEYLNGFFTSRKIVIVNDILYIFLRDSKNILIYDLDKKLLKSNEEKGRCQFKAINYDRNIYLTSFESPISSIVYSEDNLILFLENGTKMITGKNTNNKIAKSDKKEYINFIPFDIPEGEVISFIKIYKNHIYSISEDMKGDNYKLLIHGDLNEDYAIKESECDKLRDSFYQKKEFEEFDFLLSDDEKKIHYYSVEGGSDVEMFDDFKIVLTGESSLKLVSHEVSDEDEEIVICQFNYDQEVTSYSSNSISGIYRLKNNAAIIEVSHIIDPKEIHYDYFIIGSDKEKTFRLGFNEEDYEESDSLSSIHKISDAIQIDNVGSKDKRVQIKQIESFENRTIILMSNSVAFGSGLNDGYFIQHSNTEGKSNTLETFTILSEDIFCKTDGFAVTRNTSKVLSVFYNKDTCIGIGSYYFLGMNMASGFRYNNGKVKEMYEETANDKISNSKTYSYFCTKNCFYHIGPISDLTFNVMIKNTFDNHSIEHVIHSLLALKSMSVSGCENAYIRLVNNLSIAGKSFGTGNKYISKTDVLYSILQNYSMHDSMLLMYDNDVERYNSVSKFINLIGLMGENYYGMKTKDVIMGDKKYEDFKNSLADINYESKFMIEERLNAIKTKNNFRAF